MTKIESIQPPISGLTGATASAFEYLIGEPSEVSFCLQEGRAGSDAARLSFVIIGRPVIVADRRESELENAFNQASVSISQRLEPTALIHHNSAAVWAPRSVRRVAAANDGHTGNPQA